MNFDEVIIRINGFGRYQKRLYSLLVLVNGCNALTLLMTVFILGEHQHRCSLHDADNDQTHHNITGRATDCAVYYYNHTTNVTVEESCSSWTYEPPSKITPISDFDLVCGDKLLTTHANMAMFLGTMVGAGLSGLTGDVFGRKPIIMTAVTTCLISSIVCSFSPNYGTFVAMRFIAGCSTMPGFEAAFIIATEMVDPNHRVFVGIVIELVWCAGEVLLCGLAYFVTSWRTLMLISAAPYILLLSYGYFVPESPRWLLSQGRKKEAMKILRKVADVNRTILPQEDIEVPKPSKKHQEILPIFKSAKLTCRLLVLIFTWFVISLSYYGLTLNVGKIGGNVYVNFLISSIVEAMGYLSCIFINDRFGRKWMNCGGLVLAGVACLSTIFTTLYADKSLHWITITLSMVGKFGVCGAFGNIYIYTAELFPTTLRTFVLSLSNLGARLGSLLSPYVADIGILVDSAFGRALPIIIFGCLFLSAGCLSSILPETMGIKLPETIDDLLDKPRVNMNLEQMDMIYTGGKKPINSGEQDML